MGNRFAHERLDCFHMALEVAQWVRKAPFPTGEAGLRDQLKRSSSSVVLNIAEGASASKGNRKKHFRHAAASAAETAAGLTLLELPGGSEQVERLRSIARMLDFVR
jgi:four helix bundle protein